MTNSKNKNEYCGVRDFENEEKRITKLTKSTLNIIYPIYWSGLNLIKDVIELLIKETADCKESTGQYNLAYLMLLNRSVQHIESIRLLTERGLYGDGFFLLRGVMSDLSMMTYLHYHEELLGLFLSEQKEDYQKNQSFKEAFKESAIEKDLTGRGMKPFSSSFQILSKTSHSSAFGSQLYGSRGEGKNYHFNYGPKYQAEKSIILMDIITSSYYDLVANVLWHRNDNKEEINTNGWKNVRIKLSKLKGQITINTQAVKDTIKIMWPELINEN